MSKATAHNFEMRAPLVGVRVLDLTRLLPGPAATLQLADLGADVIKIEDTGDGDNARSMGPMLNDTSILFALLNRNKRNLLLNLKKSAGRELFLRLAGTADIVVESFRPGVVDRLGIGYAQVRALNPRVVYCSITGFGQTGPHAQRAGHDVNYLAYSGVLDQIGAAGGSPTMANLQIADLLGGSASALVGILAALIGTRLTGQGRYVDVSMTDAVMAYAFVQLLPVLATGSAASRGQDFLSGSHPCYAIYRTADGRHMVLGALEHRFWQRFCMAIDRPDLEPFHLATGEDARYAKGEVQAMFLTRPQSHWAKVFRKVDCCVTPVLRMDESMKEAHVRARGMFVEADGTLWPTLPFRMEKCQPKPNPAIDRSEKGTEEILAELGISEAELCSLREDGVIGAASSPTTGFRRK